MTDWSPAQIAAIWERNGGARNTAQVAVAVALAESGGNDGAVSTSLDVGLWQINEANFPSLRLTWATAQNPDRNAAAAIIMSGNGTNWADWCTCWVNPARDCGHGFLPVPQAGSPAYYQLTRLPWTIGGGWQQQPAAGPVPNVHSAGDGWALLGQFVGAWHVSRLRGYTDINTSARSMIR